MLQQATASHVAAMECSLGREPKVNAVENGECVYRRIPGARAQGYIPSLLRSWTPRCVSPFCVLLATLFLR